MLIITMLFKQIFVRKITAVIVITINMLVIFTAQATNWQKLTIIDLQAVHHYLLNDSAGGADKQNSAFTHWLDNGYQKALLLTKKVNTASSYNLVMNYYTNGFHDEHIEYVSYLNYLQFKQFWPGFTVYFENNKFYVSNIARDKKDKNLPEKNSELINCDDISAKQLMLERVFPYFGNPHLNADWHISTPRLFFYTANPWFTKFKTCKFKINDKSKTFTLHWKAIGEQKSRRLRCLASYNYQPITKIKYFTKNNVWVSLASFMPRTKKQIDALSMVIKQAKQWRNKKIIIIDVRGNTGGNSIWGTKFLQNLYGKNYFQQQIDKSQNPIYQWRISKGNIKELSGFYLHYAERNFGTNSQNVKQLKVLIHNLQNSLTKQQLYYPTQINITAPIKSKTNFSNPVSAKVYLLTDGRCASSCLTFADQLFQFPHVIQIGQATHADTFYTESRLVKLPSGARLYFPIKVQRNRLRLSNQAYIPQPQYYYHGDINNTVQVQRWLLHKIY